jgi:DNA-binding GntR family transcriptional regulator
MGKNPPRSAVPSAKPGGDFLYISIRNLLASKIESGDIAPGTVLKEAQISVQLGISRAPVRRALAMLMQEGLIRPASGQGHIVGESGAPLQVDMRRLHEIFTGESNDIDRTALWERIYETVRNEVAVCMPFGTYRILETELGNFHKVSRTVAREVLWRLMDSQLIEKDRKSHWIVAQMTARDLRETVALRSILEPQALSLAAPRLDRAKLGALAARVAVAIDSFPACGPVEVDAIEASMGDIAAHGLRNSRMLAAIRRNQISLVVSRLFRRHFSMIDDLPALHEFSQILMHLMTGSADIAEVLLRGHFARIEPLVRARLRVLSQLPPPQVAYLTPVG